MLRRLTGAILSGQPRPPGLEVRDAAIAGVPVRHYRAEGAELGRMVYCHGGGFISGSLDSHDALCCHVALALGMEIVAVGYRLAPEHPAPAQLEDVLAVMLALANQPGALLVGGDSAGAYLAVRTGLASHSVGAGRIAAMLLIYPFVDLAGQRDTVTAIAAPTVATMRAQVGEGYSSLLAMDLTAAAPAVVLWGGLFDPVAPGAARLADALAMAGHPVVRQHYPALPHGGLNLAGRFAPARQIIHAAAAEMRALARLA